MLIRFHLSPHIIDKLPLNLRTTNSVLRRAIDRRIFFNIFIIASVTSFFDMECLKGIEKKEYKKTVRRAQQELAQNCGFGQENIWDLLSQNDSEIMKNKIKQLIPDQEKGQNKIVELRELIFENIWEQRKYTNQLSLSSIFYVMVTKDKNFTTALDASEFSCHPVFRCKKCYNDYSDTSGCCMIYIDETGRVYQNWNSFINENVLPPETMIVPRNGIYHFNNNNEVILDVYCTPSGTPEAKAMNAVQTGSAVVGFGAAAVPLAALAIPIAAPIMTTAGVIALGVGTFSAVTSALNLSDRIKHSQSISLTNSQARASYLGLIGGATGIASLGATRIMTAMAGAGKATAGIEVLVNGINISSIILSGSGLASGALDLLLKYKDGDQISSIDIIQLSGSLLLFTHSVYNFQLASHLANNARNNSIKAYRDTLSNRQKKMFDKISRETMRIRGSTRGKVDIIRGINEIPDRQYLNDLFKINKDLNRRNVRAAFPESGKNIVLNNELHVDTAALRENVQYQKGPDILEQVTRPVPGTYNSDTYTLQSPKEVSLFYTKEIVGKNANNVVNHEAFNNGANGGDSTSIFEYLAITLKSGDVICLAEFGTKFIKHISDGDKFKDILSSMVEHLLGDRLKFFLKIAQEFIENHLTEIEEKIKMFIPTESVLYCLLKVILNKFRDLNYNFFSRDVPEIIRAIKKHFLSLNSTNPSHLSSKCPHCPGMYYICEL